MKYAVVTGCDHGLGLALAQALAERGWRVAACRVDPKEGQIDALAERFRGQVDVIDADVRDDALPNLRKLAFPHVDLLINCAGILGDMEDGPGDELDFAKMQRVYDVNALGPLRVTAALLPLIEKSEDKTIVNISSEAGSIQDCWRKGWFGYCMSKAANNMQGALIHNSLRPLGGRVIQMHPGHVATWMRGHLDTTARITPEVSAQGILRVVLDTLLPVRDRPLYLDWTGAELKY